MVARPHMVHDVWHHGRPVKGSPQSKESDVSPPMSAEGRIMEFFHHRRDLLLADTWLRFPKGVDVVQFPAFQDIFVGPCPRLAPFSSKEVTQGSALQVDDNILIPIIFVHFSPQGVGRIGVVNLGGSVVQL